MGIFDKHLVQVPECLQITQRKPDNRDRLWHINVAILPDMEGPDRFSMGEQELFSGKTRDCSMIRQCGIDHLQPADTIL